MMFALATSIAVPSLVFSTETVTQQPQGITINVVNETLKKFASVSGTPTAAGVTTATAFVRVSPSSCKATEIGPTTPPSATAMFALNVTR